MTQLDKTVSGDYSVVLAGTMPLIDVRSPVEFCRGSIPGSINLPLMNDEERHLVGLRYKQHGKEEALKLGHQLVSGPVRDQRINAWTTYLEANPDAVLFCSRGGLRSQISQQWIEEVSGITVPRVEGGYKALRKEMIDQLHPEYLNFSPIMLGGRTGCGKTILLGRISNSIDLEAIANHRGSSFGCHIDPQPGQADFENRLACEIIRHNRLGHSAVVLESEGTHVGRCYLPKDLSEFLRNCPLIMLEVPFDTRVMAIYKEYVLEDQAVYRSRYNEERGLAIWYEEMFESLRRIEKRLGPQRADAAKTYLCHAHQKQLQSGSPDDHTAWIELLLREYYDPMYDYNYRKNPRKVIFSGGFEEVLSFIGSYTQ